MFKLTGANYSVWKSKMGDMLVCKDLRLLVQYENTKLDKIDSSTSGKSCIWRQQRIAVLQSFFACQPTIFPYNRLHCFSSAMSGGSIAFGCRSIGSGHHYPIVLHPFTKVRSYFFLLFFDLLAIVHPLSSGCFSVVVHRQYSAVVQPPPLRPLFGHLCSVVAYHCLYLWFYLHQ